MLRLRPRHLLTALVAISASVTTAAPVDDSGDALEARLAKLETTVDVSVSESRSSPRKPKARGPKYAAMQAWCAKHAPPPPPSPPTIEQTVELVRGIKFPTLPEDLNASDSSRRHRGFNSWGHDPHHMTQLERAKAEFEEAKSTFINQLSALDPNIRSTCPSWASGQTTKDKPWEDVVKIISYEDMPFGPAHKYRRGGYIVWSGSYPSNGKHQMCVVRGDENADPWSWRPSPMGFGISFPH